ncbi:hypothetical protein ABTY61_22810 [Kitasatospora sp. NPDC096128]|uniref:hypothetical protein n=1 Tax=Kitasatospora sp. NPDC096128 TaxID=3155547 RepID=UPI00332A25B8
MHDLKFDPASPLGAKIAGLFNQIKTDIEEDDGSWPGGDVVDALDRWFGELGIDVEDDVIATNATADASPAVDLTTEAIEDEDEDDGHHDCLGVHAGPEGPRDCDGREY